MKGLLRPSSEPVGAEREDLSGDFLVRLVMALFSLGLSGGFLTEIKARSKALRHSGVYVASSRLRVALFRYKSHGVSFISSNFEI